ncbi:MAG: AEC family transporter [Clostridia bacterium]|nr:AEC family transporter [Clostridia bacterium]
MSIASQCAILFIIVLTGVFCRKRGFFTDEVIRGVTQLVVNITVPALTISSMQRPFDRAVLVGVLQTMLFTTLITFLSLALGLFLFRKRPHDRRAVMANITTFTNCGFMGFPIILAVNPDWMIYAVTFSSTNCVFVWSLGAMLFADRSAVNMRKILLNPNIIAALLGFVLFLGSFSLPAIANESLSLIGGMTTPLTMLLIGTRVCGIRLSELGERDYHIAAFLRLIAVPLAVYVLLLPITLSDAVRGVLFLLTAMPAGTVIAMLAEVYDSDAVFASRAIAWTTLLALATVPALGMLL